MSVCLHACNVCMYCMDACMYTMNVGMHVCMHVNMHILSVCIRFWGLADTVTLVGLHEAHIPISRQGGSVFVQ